MRWGTAEDGGCMDSDGDDVDESETEWLGVSER